MMWTDPRRLTKRKPQGVATPSDRQEQATEGECLHYNLWLLPELFCFFLIFFIFLDFGWYEDMDCEVGV